MEAKNLPYTHPCVLIQAQLKREKREQAFKNFPLDPDTLRRTSADHAIRRWRSYTRRPPGTPAPDDSWIQECPCGAQHPCAHHDGLSREVRYIKPANSDYAAALKRHGIPVYTPTPEELQPSSTK